MCFRAHGPWWFRTALVAVCAILFTASATTLADEPANPPRSPADVIKDLQDILVIKSEKPPERGSPELEKIQESRQKRIAEWIKTVDEWNVDLGREGYVKAFAYYLDAKLTSGPRTPPTRSVSFMTEHLARHGALPQSASQYTGWIDRILPMVIREIVLEEETRLPLFRDAMTSWADYGQRGAYAAYSSIGRDLTTLTTPKSLEFRMEVVRLTINHKALTAQEKDQALAYIYSSASGDSVVAFTHFDGKTLAGSTLKTSDFKGKVLLIDYWATWCGPCLAEMPHVVSLHQDFHEQGLEVVGVSLDSEGAEERLTQTMDKLGMTWPQVYDGGGTSTKPAVVNNVYGIPMTFLIDRQGVARYTGLRGEALREKVTQLLKEEPSQNKPAEDDRPNPRQQPR
jgi:thiol-disulfide isomerase/thioredoxin